MRPKELFLNRYETQNEIENFLHKVDRLFPTYLSQKTNIEYFAEKLCSVGTISGIYEDNILVSMVAGYTNDTTESIAYISVVATLPEYSGKGYAKQALSSFIQEAKEKGMKKIHLYTDPSNNIAISLYQSFGFVEWNQENDNRKHDIHFIKEL